VFVDVKREVDGPHFIIHAEECDSITYTVKRNDNNWNLNFIILLALKRVEGRTFILLISS
jgi:hypothetical protein